MGTHLQAVLQDAGDTVLLSEADITDRTALLAEFGAAEPDVVYHLAAQADVGGSWTEPVETFRVNAEGTLNVLDAARLAGARRVLAITSADLYGRLTEADMPLREEQPLRPVTPYGASKAAADMLCIQAGLGHGLDVVRVQPSPSGRSERQVRCVCVASRIAAAERSGETRVRVESLDAAGFTDVRDVVQAYRAPMADGEAGGRTTSRASTVQSKSWPIS